MLNFPFNRGMGYGGGQMQIRFEEQYQCYSMAVSGRAHLEEGDKILLPPSALDTLARMSVEYPMLFELTNPSLGKRTHCGVLEFSAEEGRCYIPFWMMQNLVMGEGSLITVKNVSLPKAQYVKFRPQSIEFLDISNPRAVLECSLRKFTCITTGDHILIQYLGKNYYLEIREVKPSDAASIIETDCNVDFEEPEGYKESQTSKYEQSSSSKENSSKTVATVRELQKAKSVSQADLIAAEKVFKPFTGGAQRVDGKGSKLSSESKLSAPDVCAKGTAQLSHPEPTSTSDLSAIAQPRASRIGDKFSKKKTAVSAFTGTGHRLK